MPPFDQHLDKQFEWSIADNDNRALLEIHRSTISLHRAKTDYSYPTIRLPHTLSKLAGLRTRIYQTVHAGALAFLVVVSPLCEAPTASKKVIENSDKQPESVAFTRLPFSKISPFLPYFQSPRIFTNNGYLYPNTNVNEPQSLAELALSFTQEELLSYTTHRKTGLAKKSIQWLDKASHLFWLHTEGIISKKNLDTLRQYVVNKYTTDWSKSKVLSFAVAFLKYLSKTRLDTRYRAYELFLEQPKVLKERKRVTNRIVTKEDIESVLTYIAKAELEGRISHYQAQQFTGFVIFSAYTGQRSMATASKLIVAQSREALKMDKPVLLITAKQCKIKFEHYCPLHPAVVAAVKPLLEGREDDEAVFSYDSFANFVRKDRNEIPLSKINSHFVIGDLRKFAEQYGDIIQWEQSNRAYILTHGVSGVEWAHYRHPLPEYVYDVYMRYWRQTKFSTA